MCGIAGGYNIPGFEDAKKVLEHRGPDSFGIWKDDNVTLVHTRLAILDLSPTGHQPMEFEDLVISYNGEVYNFDILRKTLSTKGYHFNSTSDTEVILKAYHYWGEDCVKKFNGMFAFAIYNKKEKSFFIARDHIGIKPLYYYSQGNKLGFASELKAFPKACRNEINEKAIIEFLALSYIPAPLSIYKNIYKLEPGHFILFKNDEITLKKYWDINDINSYENKFTITSYNEALELVDESLHKSVREQLVADVKVGSFLSGGIDSSLITAIAQKESTTQIHSYSMGFPEKDFDESPHAIAIARHLGTKHTNLTFTHKDVLSLVDNYDYYFDEPFGDSASLPLSVLCKKAKEEGLTVALTGDGGDELFLGYSRYKFAPAYYNKFKNNPKLVNKLISKIFSISGNDKALKMQYPVENPSLENFYQVVYSAIKPWDLKKIFKSDFLLNHFGDISPKLSDILNINYFDVSDAKDLALLDFQRNLPDDMLTKSDRAAMRFSMELRVPILDKNIAELSRQIPLHLLMHKGVKKSILKDLLNKYVPKELTDRPKKGFGVPLEIWFRNELKNEVLSIPDGLPQFIDKKFVNKIISEHLYKNRNHSYTIWNLMRLNAFFKNLDEE